MKLIPSRTGLALAALLVFAADGQAAQPAVTEATLPSLAPMVKKVGPTVVSIATKGTIKSQGNPLLEDPFFRRFFDLPPGGGGGGVPRDRPFQSAGSGVVVDAANGYIITNAHVIENASEITITAQDDHEYKADVVGADEGSDIAVLKLKQGKLPAIALGDSNKLEVGDFVVAIGNPFGLQHTVTSGIVSALGRVGIGDPTKSYEDFIQTDASINPGNSGGALVNLRGELVGINSAILSRSGGNMGIGFAIPVNMVKNVMDQLIKFGTVKRGILGVNIVNVTPDVVQAMGAPPDTQGALVTQVVGGSAAEKAGIKVNDIISSVNGENVKGAPELKRAIGMLHIGDKVDVGLVRDGKPRKVTAVVTENAAAQTVAATDVHEGLEGAQLSDADNAGGVAVRAIEPGSPAAQNGLRANDLIIGVNRARVANLKELKDASEGYEAIILTIRRGSDTLSIPVR
ncbi:MAG TPA: DegQ family serine endoprotease [Steroidobacteraceae bacterium]|nr:DegQ family serine endoprotease [Steroidobacteraceae bacterium]